MNFLMAQADINSFAILIIVLVILIIVVKPREVFNSLYKKTSLQNYLNTQAKVRSVAYAPNGIITIDVDGYVIAWNGGACNLFGYKEEEMLGKSLSIIIPDRYRDRHIKALQKVKETGQSSMFGKCVELTGLTKGKVEFPITLTLWKWYDGSNVFYTGIINDITELKEEERKHLEILNIYKKGEEILDSGVWSWDVLEDKVKTTEGFNRIFDIEGRNDVSSTYLLKRVYYEDLAKVEAAIKNAFDKNEGYTIEYRVVTRNGTLIKVRVNAEVYLDKDQKLINISGTIRKIK